jgi:tetratricopeptide (TPR) repeat protein
MFHPQSLTVAKCLALVLLCLSGGFYGAPVSAQPGPESIAQLKARIEELTRQTKYTEALPLLEKIVIAEPENAEMHFQLAFALIAQANNTKDDTTQKQLRIRARKEFVRAKELGATDPLVAALIYSIPADGSAGPDFSPNIKANALMIEAEALFGQGKLDEALRLYQNALESDPKLYHAALFAGDVFVQKEDFKQAEMWYQRAIEIDPNRETAYRYSATPLMKLGQTEAARDRFIEAFITEPYNQFARAGLIQWAQATDTQIAHPAIEIPTSVTFDEQGNANVKLSIDELEGGKEDGSFAWISYGMTRSTWRKEKFAKAFPNETAYRHSLAEEADALRSVVALATSDKKKKGLSVSLARLQKLDEEGLLEAYILLARPDEGIARDHPAYLKDNRDKLRRYLLEYVVTGGGN